MAPRYQPGQPRKPRTIEVDLPELAQSFLLRKFTLRERTEWIADNASEEDHDDESIREQLARNEKLTIDLITRVLEEPKMTAEELGKEVQDWAPADFDALSSAAGDVVGLDKEAIRDAEATFQGQD